MRKQERGENMIETLSEESERRKEGIEKVEGKSKREKK